MKFFISSEISYSFTKRNLEWILLVLSSLLLGIWAVKETIALRNFLLISGTLISIYYIVNKWRHGELKDQCTIWKILPIVLIGLVFFWVISHFLFFSLDPIKQFKELTSTWLRAFMASIVGLATGLALRNHPNRLNFLWFGIFIAFLVLYYQYIPRALAQKKLLVPDYEYYLFHLKINTVLMGMILTAGIDGALLDNLRYIKDRRSNLKFWYLLYWFLGTGFVLWAFVYIVDSRNGIGVSIILYSFWFLSALVFFVRSQNKCLNLNSLLALLMAAIGLCLILYFALLQTNVNKGWDTFWEDAKLAVQIDRHENWQNPSQMGYPQHADGRVVTPNTYERIAWMTAGTRAVIDYPLGVGVLAFPFAKHPNPPPKMSIDISNQGIATHSGWVELGLAFGIPILSLIFLSLLITFIQAISNTFPAKMTVLGLIVLISSLYAVGEVAIQHGIEILFYLLTLMPALIFYDCKSSPCTNRG